MSQPGYIYVLFNASANGIVKIGKTHNDPNIRAKELSSATGVPTPFILVYQAYFNDCDKAEIYVHTKLERYRIADNREFFQVAIPNAIDSIIEAKKYYSKVESVLDFPENDNKYDGTNDFLESLITEEVTQPGKDLYELADSYYFGLKDTIQDYDEAFNLYTKAARLGYADAYRQLGVIFRDGEGRGADNKRALEFFKEGIKQGNDECWAEMAILFNSSGQLDNENKCWNKFFTSSKFHEFSNRAYYIYHYVKNNLAQNKPLGYKVQIVQVKSEVLDLLNGVEKIEIEKGQTYSLERLRKINIAIKEL